MFVLSKHVINMLVWRQTCFKWMFDDADAEKFSKKLLEIGNGTMPEINGKIELTELRNIVKNLNELIEKIYPNISEIKKNEKEEWFCERAILTPRNVSANEILNPSNLIPKQIPGEENIYESIDTMSDDESRLG